MVDIRGYSLAAVMLLVVLRVSIGWQLLYEGMWKINTLSTQSPWSSDGYLKNAQGPFRGLFRSMSGDPDDKLWLDPDSVAARWDSFNQRFSRHYQLNDGQKSQLKKLLDGASSHSGRRGFLTNLAEKGVSVRVMMALAGHANMATTQRYIDLRPGVLRNAVELV